MNSVRVPYLELRDGYPDRSRPMVTHHDASGTRVELSVTATAVAVAKAAGLLRDELSLPPGAEVSVDLPVHWQLPVWVLAAWSIGAVVGRDRPGPVDVRVVGPEQVARIAAGADPGAEEVLGCACDPWGMPMRSPVPAGVLDIGVEVRSQPDVLDADPGAIGSAALWDDGSVIAVGQLGPTIERLAAAAGMGPGGRLWVDQRTRGADLLLGTSLVPIARRGSVVLGSGLAEQRADEVRAMEQVTAQL